MMILTDVFFFKVRVVGWCTYIHFESFKRVWKLTVDVVAVA